MALLEVVEVALKVFEEANVVLCREYSDKIFVLMTN